MKKSTSPLANGFILCGILVFLAVYFSFNSLWNVGTVFVEILVAALAGFQFFIYFGLIRGGRKK